MQLVSLAEQVDDYIFCDDGCPIKDACDTYMSQFTNEFDMDADEMLQFKYDTAILMLKENFSNEEIFKALL